MTFFRYGTAITLLFTLAQTGYAQSADAGSQTDEESSRIEETIIVTGQRSYYDKDASSAARVDLPIIETAQSIFVINALD